MTRVAVNGVHYHVERAGSGTPLVLLHGFTGSVVTWAPFLPTFARAFDTIAIDLLGHGESAAPVDAARYQPECAVADLVALLDRLGVGRAAWLGYSLGGRVALRVAVERPTVVAALVLEGVSPGIADDKERAERARSDEALAEFIEREGMTAFVDHWERVPLFASQARLPDAPRATLRGQRLGNEPAGLANSLRGMGQGAQPSLRGRLREVVAPTLLVVGEEDVKFRRLAVQMATEMPSARIAVVAGAGHATHLDQPDEFQRIVLGFLGPLDWS